MGNILSDNVRDDLRTGRESTQSLSLINLVTSVDLGLIIPAVSIFLAYNLRSIANLAVFQSALILCFLLYLPTTILFAGRFLGRRMYKEEDQTGVLSVILFFLLLFSVLGIYLPSMQKLSSLIPSFQVLIIIGAVVVILNLFFLLRNSGKIFHVI
ncbi:MAG: hypothetical protein ACP5UO_04120 [Thermoplasmata archaeon]